MRQYSFITGSMVQATMLHLRNKPMPSAAVCNKNPFNPGKRYFIKNLTKQLNQHELFKFKKQPYPTAR
jgi:hypothetical protein